MIEQEEYKKNSDVTMQNLKEEYDLGVKKWNEKKIRSRKRKK